MTVKIDLVRALRDNEYQSEIDDALKGFDDEVLRHAAADEISRLRIENAKLRGVEVRKELADAMDALEKAVSPFLTAFENFESLANSVGIDLDTKEGQGDG